jgi:hypothetical protein
VHVIYGGTKPKEDNSKPTSPNLVIKRDTLFTKIITVEGQHANMTPSLLNLPPAIRELIYFYLFLPEGLDNWFPLSGTPIDPDRAYFGTFRYPPTTTPIYAALLNTCPLLNTEVTRFIYSEARFFIRRVRRYGLDPVKSLAASRLQLMRRLRIDLHMSTQ